MIRSRRIRRDPVPLGHRVLVPQGPEDGDPAGTPDREKWYTHRSRHDGTARFYIWSPRALVDSSRPIAGDRPAFERLFREHYRPLCAFAMQYVKDGDRAQDLVQDLFIRLWEERERLNIATSIKSYLFTAVRNRCLNALSATARLRPLDEETDDRVEEDQVSEDEHIAPRRPGAGCHRRVAGRAPQGLPPEP